MVDERTAVSQEFADSYLWWDDFLEARMKAIQAMMVLGKSREEIMRHVDVEDVQFQLLCMEAEYRNSRPAPA